MKFKAPAVLIALLLGVSTFALITTAHQKGSLDDLGAAPVFSLTTASGQTLSSESLRGKVWTIDFFFTSCPHTCPVTHGAVARLQEEFRNKSAFTSLSVTVDPDHDTLDVLTNYALKTGAAEPRWTLLRGPIEEVKQIARQGFHLGVSDNPALHSGSIALVDRNFRIRGYFRAGDEGGEAQLQQAIEEIL